jgi:Tfp pilus assembly protein PilV
LIVSTAAAQRRAMFVLALTLALAGSRFVTQTWAAGAFAIGKCGAYGQAFDYAGEGAARAAALKQCKGECTAVTMKRACAALAIDMSNPCGAHGYAVKPRISSSLNAATRKCYEFGGKECVIRAWACDAKG